MSLFGALFGPDINQVAAEARATDGAVIVDVRTPEEYAEGHLPGAVNLPLDRLDEAPRAIGASDLPLYVYCLSGARSSRARALLGARGYANVTDMGGINRWSGQVVTGRSQS